MSIVLSKPLQLVTVAGTRPESLKLASLVGAALQHPDINPLVVSTGQHPAMVAATFAHLELPVHYQLPAVPAQTMLSRTVAFLRRNLAGWMREVGPDVVLVQGDTSSAYAGALAAADCGIPLVHLEAGLRTSNPLRPFPEEHFRRSISPLCDLHLVPTPGAAQHLLQEGYAESRIKVVGNSIVDILRTTMAEPRNHNVNWQDYGQRLAVLTLHRRENYQHGLVNVCSAMMQVLDLHPELCLVCPVHPNPLIGSRIRRQLGFHPRVLLTPPLLYRDFISLLQQAALVVTDSGGIQEEAPYIGVPVLVARDETERPEALLHSGVQLVGSTAAAVTDATRHILVSPRPPACGFDDSAPFGDGRTAERVLRLLLQCYQASHQAA